MRYFAFNEEMKRLFGGRVDRITVNAGFTCPNVDGKRAKGGCTFCQDASYWGLSFKEEQPIAQQIQKGMDYLRERNGTKQFFAYFQNGTNTYAPVPTLRRVYEEALAFPEIVGLFLATRPDCLEEPVLDLLQEIHEKTYLWVEVGMPSHREDRNRRLNRAHTVEEFEKSVMALASRGIRTCVHVIHGIPGETEEEIIAKAHYFNRFPIQGMKIHNMVVFTDTVLEKQYKEGKYVPLTLEEYTRWCVVFLEHLRPDILIHRLNAHGPRHVTVAPDWSVNKWNTINALHGALESLDTRQGIKWREGNLPLAVKAS